jgi:hypothetical protein
MERAGREDTSSAEVDSPHQFSESVRQMLGAIAEILRLISQVQRHLFERTLCWYATSPCGQGFVGQGSLL